MTSLRPTLGIDFGTSNTAAAVLHADGRIEPVPIGSKVALPSVVHFPKEGDPTVGELARQALADDPQNTIIDAKRFMGRRFLSGYVGRHVKRYAYELCEGPDGLTAVRAGGRVVPLADVAGHIIARIVELGSAVVGEPVKDAVLSCPAYFTHRQRRVLRHVAQKAGLRVRAMINEPTAAALRYASTHGGDRLVLVCDLGGGTFDTTLIRVRNGLVAVLETGGDPFLGGTDFDLRVARALAGTFEAKHGIDIREDRVVTQRLKSAAEDAKIRLSDEEEARVSLPGVAVRGSEFLDLNVRLTRDQLTKLCTPLIDRVVQLALETVHRAGTTPDAIDEAVLVGGQLKMPVLQERLSGELPINPNSQLDPDIAVALGAVDRVASDAQLIDNVGVTLYAARSHEAPYAIAPADAPVPSLRAVEVDRPPQGEPLVLDVFELVGRERSERDVLGGLVVPSQWLERTSGALVLEAYLAEDYRLSLALKSEDGHERRLKLDDRSWPQEASGFESVPTQPGVEDRVEVARNGYVRVSGNEEYVPCSVREVSTKTVLVTGGGGWALDQRVELIIVAGEVPLSLRAEVVERFVPAAGEGTFVLELVRLVPAARSALESLMLGSGPEPVAANEPSPAASPAVAEAPGNALGDALERFVDNVMAGDLYVAFGLDPFCAPGDLAQRASILSAMLDDADRADGALADRVDQLRPILQQSQATLTDVRSRLAHDFRAGHILVSERIARQAEGGIFDVTICREVWRDVYPQAAPQVKQRLAAAAAAEFGSDFASALGSLREAIQLDPFDLALRERERRVLGRAQLAGG